MKKLFKNLPIHIILIITSILSIFPFIWLISTSLKGNSENIFAYSEIARHQTLPGQITQVSGTRLISSDIF